MILALLICGAERAGEARGARSAEGRAALLALLQLLGEGWLLLCMFRCGVRARSDLATPEAEPEAASALARFCGWLAHLCCRAHASDVSGYLPGTWFMAVVISRSAAHTM